MKRFVATLIILSCLCFSVWAKAKDEASVRLLYWNIQNGMWSGQGDNYNTFVKWVKEKNPDICVWCEASSNYRTASAEKLDDKERFLPEGWQRLAKRYGHKHVYKGGHRDNFPQVITSRYPIENVERIVGNNRDSVVSHGAGWARIRLGKKQFNIVTLHTWPQAYGFSVKKEDRKASRARFEGDRYRRMEIEYILKNTIATSENAQNEYWLMMGDFNAISRVDNHIYRENPASTKFLVHDYIHSYSPYIDLLWKKNPGDFFRTTGSGKRIDFIYVTDAMYKLVSNAGVVYDCYTTPVRDPQKLSNFWHPSDHLPIVVDFRVENLK
ncbi:MAG: endonuclease [Alistipes sp.]|nr:endonuclease [Candidatus Alistipes equi]